VIDQYAAGSRVMQDIMNAPAIEVSGTYSLYFEYCEPKSGSPKGIFQTHHGIVGNAAYWNVQLGWVPTRQSPTCTLIWRTARGRITRLQSPQLKPDGVSPSFIDASPEIGLTIRSDTLVRPARRRELLAPRWDPDRPDLLRDRRVRRDRRGFAERRPQRPRVILHRCRCRPLYVPLFS